MLFKENCEIGDIKALVVNFFGGPGVGKSTTATGVYNKLKKKGVNAEYVSEYAKDKIWEGSYEILENQVAILGKQHQRIYRVAKKVEVVVTDAPVFNSVIYNKNKITALNPLVRELHDKFNNLNILLKRGTTYNPNGRIQTEEEAKEVDKIVEEYLKKFNVFYIPVELTDDASHEEFIVDQIITHLYMKGNEDVNHYKETENNIKKPCNYKDFNGHPTVEYNSSPGIKICKKCGKTIRKGEYYFQVKVIKEDGTMEFSLTCSGSCAETIQNKYYNIHKNRADDIKYQSFQMIRLE